jgi:hypothetical protein
LLTLDASISKEDKEEELILSDLILSFEIFSIIEFASINELVYFLKSKNRKVPLKGLLE